VVNRSTLTGASSPPPSLLLVGHGSRSPEGVAQYWSLHRLVTKSSPKVRVGGGFIELAAPDLDRAIDRLVEEGARHVVGVPLVLLGAGHLKTDGPAALAAGRRRHPQVRFDYGRDLGIHPLVLDVAAERAREALTRLGPPADDRMVVLVGRGSTDPDANADLYKVCRLLSDSRGLGDVEPAFVSLAPPAVPAALERCRRLGARRVAVVPYFLFTGLLVDRIRDQVEDWSGASSDVVTVVGGELGPDERIATLVWERYEEALAGTATMNCDLCVYRIALPGYEHRVGPHHHPAHGGHDGAETATSGA
jgi:sirohydrochlorin cobaltochelatase